MRDHPNFFTRSILAAAAAFCLLLSAPVHAISVAVFGDNATDNLINATFGAGSATLVTDAQLATPGFLTPFDAFYYTRDGLSFGVSLSAAAAAQVKAYVGNGSVVLLNADFADDIGTPFTNALTTNAVSFAAASGHGYIGEFNGAVAGLTSNSNPGNASALDFISGSAGALGLGNGGSSGSIIVTAVGAVHSVTSSLIFPNNPPSVEFGATLTGVNPGFVLAVFDNGNPAVVAIPEPEIYAMLAAGLGLMGFVARRRKQQLAAA